MAARSIAVVPAEAIENAAHNLATETLIVVYDSDGARAASAAARATRHRTAVYVGGISSADDRRILEDYCVDVLGGRSGDVAFLDL